MSNEPSPRPWRVEENSLGWKTCIVDANGNDVASCWGGEGINSAEPAQADAALIVDAVNLHDVTREDRHKLQEANEELFVLRDERDRLRDIVKRLADKLEAHRGIFTGAGVYSQTAQEETSKLLREARAAIVEDAP